MGYIKPKPKWVETDIPKRIKEKLWLLMKDNPTYSAWQQAIAKYGFSEEEEKYIRMSADTYRGLKREIVKMPVEEVLTLPTELQMWITQLRPELKDKLSRELVKPQISEELVVVKESVRALRQEIDARRILAGDWVELEDTPPPEI